MFTREDRQKCDQLLDRYYTGRKFNDERYSDLIRKYLRKGQRILDAGCGRHMTFCKSLSRDAEMVGIDLDTAFDSQNRSAPFAVRGDLGRLPFASEQFDMVISRSVIEHLEDPPRVFREFFRVLRPGGKVVVITPNKYDYVSIMAALTPYSVHRFIVSKIFGVSEDDVFPTRYRANSLGRLRKAFQATGFVPRELEAINHYPAYLMFSPVLFRLGILYERATSLHFLRWLRGSLLGAFEKPTTNSAETRQINNRARVEVM